MQEYCNGLPFPSPGYLPGLGIEPRSPALHCWQTLYRLSYGGSPNIPDFYAILFMIPMQYCSSWHWTLLSPLDTSTTGHCFLFGFLIPSRAIFPVLLQKPIGHLLDLGSSSFSVVSFCLFILFMGFPKLECWSGLPFPSPVGHILSELSIMTHLSWVALSSMAHSFIELDKIVIHVISLVSFLWLWFSFCLPSDGWG